MIILGIDPGSVVTGFGVIEVNPRLQPRYVASGSLRLGSGSLPERLLVLREDLQQIWSHYQPQTVVIEQVFSNINWRTALVMAHARGVILLATAEWGLPILELQPRAVKKMIAGQGGASKAWVQNMVRHRLGIEGELSLDASDALALALAYLHV